MSGSRWVVPLLATGSAAPSSAPIALSVLVVPLTGDGVLTGSQPGLLAAAGGLGLTAIMLVAGGATDRVGARRVFGIGTGVGILGLILMAILDLPWMLAGMFALGVSHGLITMASLGAVSALDPGNRIRGFALFGTLFAVALGVAGFVTSVVAAAGWSGAALLPVLVLFAIGLMGGKGLPARSPSAVGSASRDTIGALLAVTSSIVLLLAINSFTGRTGPAIPLMFCGLATTALLVVWERRQAEPVLDLALLRNRTMLVVVVVGGLASFGVGGTYLVVAQYSQFVLGAGGAGTGAYFALTALLGAVAAWASPQLLAAWGARLLLFAAIGGSALVCLSAVWLVDWLPRVYPLVALAAVSFGLGLVIAPIRSFIADSVPAASVGRAFGLNSTIRRFVQAAGTVVMIQIFSQALPGDLDSAIRAAGISPMGEGTENVGKAAQMRLEMASRLTPEEQARYVEAQDQGFTRAQQRALGLDAAALVAAALFSLALPRGLSTRAGNGR